MKRKGEMEKTKMTFKSFTYIEDFSKEKKKQKKSVEKCFEFFSL